MYISKTGEFIQKYWDELCVKAKTKDFQKEDAFDLCHPTCKLAKYIAEDFDENIALELGKVLIALYDK